MQGCIFCKIIKREIPGFIIDEDEHLIVLVSLENHPLIVPKQHIQDIFSLDDDTASLIMKKAVQISLATKEALASDGIYITQANGAAAGQDVFHYHMHIYPKWMDKHILNTDPESRREVMEKIKAQLNLSDPLT